MGFWDRGATAKQGTPESGLRGPRPMTFGSVGRVALPLLFLLAAIPFRDGLIRGEIVGSGLDVVTTLWGMWWLQHEGLSGLLGVKTLLTNHPFGAIGIVLAPASSVLWVLIEPFLGVGRALAVVCWLHIATLAWACSWLAGLLGVEKPWHWSAGLAVLVARFLFHAAGTESFVAMIGVAVPIGIGFLVLCNRTGELRHFLMLVLATIWIALENPYLSPVLPALTLLFVFRFPEQRWKLAVSLVMMSVGILAIASMYGAYANPSYPPEISGQSVLLWGRVWNFFDDPYSRMNIQEIAIPAEVSWRTCCGEIFVTQGGRYLGISTLLLSTYALLEKRSRWLWLLGLAGIILSLGSSQYNAVLPFFLFSEIVDAVARPLTQPTRFLVVTIVAFSICAAWGVSRLARNRRAWGVAALALLFLDACCLGGLRLKPPNTEMPEVACDIPRGGGVLVWPEDALPGGFGVSRLLQMSHRLPTVSIGIRAWKPLVRSSQSALEDAGFSYNDPVQKWDESTLIDLGFMSVLAEKGERVPVPEYRVQACGSFDLIVLQK